MADCRGGLQPFLPGRLSRLRGADREVVRQLKASIDSVNLLQNAVEKEGYSHSLASLD
jgi:hypothetical protein